MEIECEFSVFQNYYRCLVTKASITEKSASIKNFSGIHQPGKSNKDVDYVEFSKAKVEHFPRKLEIFFPNLKSLKITKCGLKEISREDLVGLEKLSDLNLNGNQIKLLPDDLFASMPKLKKIFFDNNRIEFASSKLIEPIISNQIESFYLHGNPSIDAHYYSGAKPGCKTIQELMAMFDEKCKPPSQMIANCDITKAASVDMEFFNGFNELRRTGRLIDFVIVAGSKEFLVHKNVLAIRSSVFAEMFEATTYGRMDISYVSTEAVEAFLDYLYERKRPTIANGTEVFKLALKYKVKNLIAACEQVFYENLDI